MLWYKAWLETRWRFLIALFLLSALCAAVILTQPMLENLQVDVSEVPGRFKEMIEESLAVASSYPGYIWSQWFGKHLSNTWTFFAVLIGTGGIVTESSRGSALWTLSLPVTRRKLFGVRAGIGALELLALALVPSLLIPALSPLIGKTYPVGEALVYSLIMFAGGMVFYSFALLLSTIFGDQLKPIIIGVSVVFILGLLSLFSKELARYSIFTVMSGQNYFMEGVLPWAGLAICAALAAVIFFLSLRVLERRDF